MDHRKSKPHPMQPIADDGHGVLRFKPNAIVDKLHEVAHRAGYGLNEIAEDPSFTAEDREQLAQLLGYSVSGFGDIPGVRPETVEAADAAAEADRGPGSNLDYPRIVAAARALLAALPDPLRVKEFIATRGEDELYDPDFEDEYNALKAALDSDPLPETGPGALMAHLPKALRVAELAVGWVEACADVDARGASPRAVSDADGRKLALAAAARELGAAIVGRCKSTCQAQREADGQLVPFDIRCELRETHAGNHEATLDGQRVAFPRR